MSREVGRVIEVDDDKQDIVTEVLCKYGISVVLCQRRLRTPVVSIDFVDMPQCWVLHRKGRDGGSNQFGDLEDRGAYGRRKSTDSITEVGFAYFIVSVKTCHR